MTKEPAPHTNLNSTASGIAVCDSDGRRRSTCRRECFREPLTPVPLAGTGLPDEVMKTFRALGGNPSAQRELRRNFSTSLDDERLEALSQLGDGVEAAAVSVFADMWNRGHPLGAQHSHYKGPVLIVRGEADPFVTAEVAWQGRGGALLQRGLMYPRYRKSKW